MPHSGCIFFHLHHQLEHSAHNTETVKRSCEFFFFPAISNFSPSTCFLQFPPTVGFRGQGLEVRVQGAGYSLRFRENVWGVWAQLWGKNGVGQRKIGKTLERKNAILSCDQHEMEQRQPQHLALQQPIGTCRSPGTVTIALLQLYLLQIVTYCMAQRTGRSPGGQVLWLVLTYKSLWAQFRGSYLCMKYTAQLEQYQLFQNDYTISQNLKACQRGSDTEITRPETEWVQWANSPSSSPTFFPFSQL